MPDGRNREEEAWSAGVKQTVPRFQQAAANGDDYETRMERQHEAKMLKRFAEAEPDSSFVGHKPQTYEY